MISQRKKKGADVWGEKILKYQRRGLITQKKKGRNFRGKLLHKLQYSATKVGSRLVENENQQNKH